MNAVAKQFRNWLHAGMTGCSYASAFAAVRGRLTVTTYGEPPVTSRLDDALDFHGQEDEAFAFVLPYLRSEDELVGLLQQLSRAPRWHVRPAGTLPSGDVLVGLDWTTANGDVSDTMGFAPMFSMPVPRRAPYVAIAAWPGGRANPFRGEPPTPRARAGQVSFLDASHTFTRHQYEKTWATTERNVGTLMKSPPDDARLYRRVAFSLSPEAAAPLFADAAK